MKRIFTLLLIALPILVFGQDNLLESSNPGFEDGVLSPWTSIANGNAEADFNISSDANLGSNAYHIKVNKTDAINKVVSKSAKIDVSGDSYAVVAKIMAKGTTGTTMKIQIAVSHKLENSGGKTISYYASNPVISLTDSYQEYELSKDISSIADLEITSIQLTLQCGAVAGDYYFDDAVLEDGSIAGPTFELTSSVTGFGSISPAEGSFPEGSVQSITAVPYLGYEFVEWGGHLNGMTNPADLTIDANKAISATFTKIPNFNFEWNFNTNGNAEAWEAFTNSSIVVENGAAKMTMTGNWPRFKLRNLGITATDFDIAEFRIKNNTIYDVNSEVPLKFIFQDANGTDRSIIIPNTTANDSEFKTYRVLLGDHDYWNGNIEALTIMGPVKLDNPADAGTIEFDYIKLLKGNDNSKLSSITSESYSLSPAFSSDVNEYNLNVPENTETVNFSAIASDFDNATVSIRQVTVENEVDVATELIDGNATLISGSAKVSIMVQAENGAKGFYVINIVAGNPLSIKNNSSELSIYPNPISAQLNIRTTGLIGAVEIYSLTGQKVYASDSGSKQIDMSQLPKGIYLAIITVDGESVQKKITKK